MKIHLPILKGITVKLRTQTLWAASLFSRLRTQVHKEIVTPREFEVLRRGMGNLISHCFLLLLSQVSRLCVPVFEE